MDLDKLKRLIVDASQEMEDELISIRRHLHQYPELSFKEYETAAYVERNLNDSGIPYKRIGETGIIATITGEKDGPGFTVGLRADLDALPIQEETGLPFASKHEGIMHACGHDGHTTILLGAARLLFEHKQHFSGQVVCIFQPGEEADGAAKELIRLGALDDPKVDATLALHLWPYLPFGVVGIKGGSMTASCDEFIIDVYGKSGHSARPHEGIDAIAVATQIIQAIQHLVNKMYNPLDPIVVHVGKIQGGAARNVIADHVRLEGTARTLSMATREKLQHELQQLIHHIAESFGARTEVEYILGHAPVTNDEEITNLIGEAVRNVWGDDMVVELAEPSLGADDFGEFSQVVPSSYFRLGIKKLDEEVYSLHHPKFNFDDKLLSKGASIFAVMALHLIDNMKK